MGSLSGSKNGPNVDDSQLVQELKMVKGRDDLSDCCFVCKDGGRLLICDFPYSGTSKDSLKDVIRVPSLAQDNVQRIFLTRSVIRKLLMEPDSFEAKVKNAFIGIELPKATPRSNIIYRELVQVKGIMKKEADNGQIEIELQAKDRPGIPIDKVSDFDFYESMCENLEQQVKDGHIEMPNLEEFEWKARVLSEALVDDYIPREERKLQLRKKKAHEFGRKEEFFHYDCMIKKLLTSEERSRLISHFQEVSTEPIDSGTGLPLMAVGNEETEGKGKEVVDVPMENLQAPSQRKRLVPSPSAPNKKATEVSADHEEEA